MVTKKFCHFIIFYIIQTIITNLKRHDKLFFFFHELNTLQFLLLLNFASATGPPNYACSTTFIIIIYIFYLRNVGFLVHAVNKRQHQILVFKFSSRNDLNVFCNKAAIKKNHLQAIFAIKCRYSLKPFLTRRPFFFIFYTICKFL